MKRSLPYNGAGNVSKFLKSPNNGTRNSLASAIGDRTGQEVKKMGTAMMRMPGIRQKLRNKLMAFGQPLYKSARTGVNLVNKIDDTLEDLGDQNIPLISNAIKMIRSNPIYQGVDMAAALAKKGLDRGEKIAQRLDQSSAAVSEAIGGVAGRVMNAR